MIKETPSMEIDWSTLPFYHQGDIYQNAQGYWYRLDGDWTPCPECATTPGVTIQTGGGSPAPSTVPEPSTVWLLGLAVVGLMLWRRRRWTAGA